MILDSLNSTVFLVHLVVLYTTHFILTFFFVLAADVYSQYFCDFLWILWMAFCHWPSWSNCYEWLSLACRFALHLFRHCKPKSLSMIWSSVSYIWYIEEWIDGWCFWFITIVTYSSVCDCFRLHSWVPSFAVIFEYRTLLIFHTIM